MENRINHKFSILEKMQAQDTSKKIYSTYVSF